jgi:hypothetical protein
MLFQKGDGGDPLYGVRQGQIRSETFAGFWNWLPSAEPVTGSRMKKSFGVTPGRLFLSPVLIVTLTSVSQNRVNVTGGFAINIRFEIVPKYPRLVAASRAKPHSTANCEPRCVRCS